MLSSSSQFERNAWSTIDLLEQSRCKAASSRHKGLLLIDHVGHILALCRTRAHVRARTRRMLSDLSMLSDHTLRDIGINRPDLQWEASKPFWRA